MTPDPAGLAAVDSGNPQTWNRYAYVNNNPTNYIDPSGLDAGNPSIWVSAFCQADPIFCAATPAAAHEFCVFIGLCGDSSSGSGSSGGGGSGGGGGTGGGAPTPIPSGNHPIGGSWPNGETNGIPAGLSAGGLNLCQLLGVCPVGSGCEFGACAPVPNGFLGPVLGNASSVLDPSLLAHFLLYLRGLFPTSSPKSPQGPRKCTGADYLSAASFCVTPSTFQTVSALSMQELLFSSCPPILALISVLKREDLFHVVSNDLDKGVGGVASLTKFL